MYPDTHFPRDTVGMSSPYIIRLARTFRARTLCAYFVLGFVNPLISVRYIYGVSNVITSLCVHLNTY